MAFCLFLLPVMANKLHHETFVVDLLLL